jgi:hypothetical protein
MRILVTGSRTWLDYHSVAHAINHYIAENAVMGVDSRGFPVDWNTSEVVIVHGACPTGADALATEYALCNWIAQEPHPADWKHLGRSAGLDRNEKMVNLGADVCLAFIDRCHKPSCRGKKPHGSHGATHCSSLAESAGIEVRRFAPE